MANYDELPVFKATYDLLLRIYMVSQHWSRDIRYTLGEELKKEVIEILQLIYQANASKKKVAFLSSCRVKLIKVRLQIRVAKDLTIRASLNSYLGYLGHYKSYKIIHKSLTGSAVFKHLYFASGYKKSIPYKRYTNKRRERCEIAHDLNRILTA